MQFSSYRTYKAFNGLKAQTTTHTHTQIVPEIDLQRAVLHLKNESATHDLVLDDIRKPSLKWGQLS